MAARRWGVDSLGAAVAMGSRYQRPAHRCPRRARSNYLPAIVNDSPEAVSAAFASAMRARDLAAAVEHWLEDALMIQADGQTLRGRDAIASALGALIDNRVVVEISLDRVLSAGDVAVGVGSLTRSGADADGEPFTPSSESAIVYARQPDGRWRLAIDAPWGLPKR